MRLYGSAAQGGLVGGIPGPQGNPGPAGPPGSAGAAGAPGAAGAAGAAGAQGPKGDGLQIDGSANPLPAASAHTGQIWVDLSDGSFWVSTGSTWSPVDIQGPVGPEGPQGETGTAGATGATGTTGATGSPGADGGTGPTGLTGPKGDKGDTGDTGATGPAGSTTIAGISGLQTALDGKQPLDSDLTALAALTTPATKLSGIATGATANDTDANLKARANHTGTQSADTLTDGTTNKAFLATERTKLTAITGTNTGDQTSVTGNAGTATALATARTINGVSFNGTADIVIKPRVGTTASSATPSIDMSLYEQYNITALAAAITAVTITNGAGKLIIRIKDNGTARALAFGTTFRAIGVTLPTTTVISKTLYLGCIWNEADSKLDVVAVGQEA